MGGPVSSRSHATVWGICRTSRTAEPPIGYRLHLASEMPNLALSPAMRMSVACRISVPPAIAGPSTAAISGLVRRRPLSSDSMTDASKSPLPAPGGVARHRLEVGARAERAARPGQDAHPNLGVSVDPVPCLRHQPGHI